MIWLQSKDEFDCLALFDPSTGALEKRSRATLGEDAPNWDEIAGSFSQVKDLVFALYRNHGQAIFRVSDNDFVLDGQTVVNVQGSGCERRMSIETMGTVVFEIDYELVGIDMLQGDPTPFVDDEDFDFGLFVSNMSKSAERRNVLLGRN